MSTRLPAEWEPQAGVLITWPHADTDWTEQLDAVEATFATLADAICRRERLLVVCHDVALAARLRAGALRGCADAGRLQVLIAASDDSWARDHGPIGVIADGRPRLLDFRFNAWGGKYPHARDDQITQTLQRAGAFGATPVRAVDLVLEGGALESDGDGTLLATRSSVIDPRRNPGLDQAALESLLAHELGIRRFLWLDHGAIAGDDTDGHIDTLVRFANRETLVYLGCDDPAHPDFAALAAMRTELEGLRTAAGNRYRLLALPPPPPIVEDGRRLAASYANYLIVNDAVLAPTYGDPADAAALRTLAKAYPGREIVAIDCRALIRQNGSLHCLTMQLPAGSLPDRTPTDQEPT